MMFIITLLACVYGHGRMIKPTTRVGHTNYEHDPVGFATGEANIGNTIPTWVCKHETALPPSVTWKAGTTVELGFSWSVNHKGFCDGMISYDWDKPLVEMRWFKIANFLDCGSEATVQMDLPDFLPSGRAVFRWSWTALHLYPQTEVFTQCSDLMIEETSNADSSIKTFGLLNPQLYPQTGKDEHKIQGVSYCNPHGWGDMVTDCVVGPPCAKGFTGNQCDLTAPGAMGHIDPWALITGETKTPVNTDKPVTTKKATDLPESTPSASQGAATCRPCTANDEGCTHPGQAKQKWCDSRCADGINNANCPIGFCICGDAPVPTTKAPVASTQSSTPSTSTQSSTPSASTQSTTPSASTNAPADNGDEVRLCYFTNWARYRSGLGNVRKDVFEMKFDATLCTHVNYGFGTIDKSTYGLKAFDPNADHPSGAESQTTLCPKICKPGYKHDWSKGSNPCDWPCNPDRVMRGFEGLNVWAKTVNPKLKSLLSVGGWNFNDCAFTGQAGQGRESCEIFSTIAASEDLSRKHAIEVIDFLRNWGFDGYDIDWEYPVVAGHNNLNMKATPQDFQNYIRLLKIIREEFEAEATRTNRPRLLLTAAVGIGKSTAEQAYDIPNMAKSLDLIGLMTYDMHGTWEQQTGFHAPLYATEEDVKKYEYPVSTSWAVEYWIEHGASPSQLLLGLASYGRGWILADSSCHTPLCATSGASKKGKVTASEGFLAYYEIEDMISQGVATRYYDNARENPYIVTDDNQWIGYDDSQSIKAKIDYLKKMGLRGSMLWAIDLDDLNSFPLMKTIRSELAGHSVEPVTTKNIVSPSSTSSVTRSTEAPPTPIDTRAPSSSGTRVPTAIGGSRAPTSIDTRTPTQFGTRVPTAIGASKAPTSRLLPTAKPSATKAEVSTEKPIFNGNGGKCLKYVSNGALTDDQCQLLCARDEASCFSTGQCKCGSSTVAIESGASALLSTFVFLLVGVFYL